MIVYCVRHRRTRNFLSAEWHSPSWWEGEKGVSPRVFSTPRAANAFITQWLRGTVVIEDDGDMHHDDRARTRDMLEIVPMELREI